jgi:hypothetical protein
VVDRSELDRESILGDEAHIISSSPGGPRYRPLPPGRADAYDNLILLCKIDHKTVDDQPGSYPEKRLLQIKTGHERWVSSTLTARIGGPIRVRTDPATLKPTLDRLTTGAEVWRVIADAQSYLFDSPDEDDDRFAPDQADAADGFLRCAQDYGDASDDIFETGKPAVREAKRDLTDKLQDLDAAGLNVFGGRRKRWLEGGIGEPQSWWESILVVLPKSDILPVDSVTLVPYGDGFIVIPGQESSPRHNTSISSQPSSQP